MGADGMVGPRRNNTAGLAVPNVVATRRREWPQVVAPGPIGHQFVPTQQNMAATNP